MRLESMSMLIWPEGNKCFRKAWRKSKYRIHIDHLSNRVSFKGFGLRKRNK